MHFVKSLSGYDLNETELIACPCANTISAMSMSWGYHLYTYWKTSAVWIIWYEGISSPKYEFEL